MRAISSVFIEAIFAILVGLIVLVLIFPQLYVPTWQVYGKEQANTLARIVALSINGLVGAERGRVTLTFAVPWDVKIGKKGDTWFVQVSHEKTRSDEMLLVIPLEEKDIANANGLVISKSEGFEIKKL